MPIKWNSIKFREVIDINKYIIDDLDEGIKISTICSSCKLNSDLNIENMYKYLSLNENDILVVKRNNQNLRSLIEIKKKKKHSNKANIKQQTTSFQNSLTIVMRSENYKLKEDQDINDEARINLKIFKNGSIQMSGCKDLYAVNRVLNKIEYILKKGKTIKREGHKVKIEYAKNPENIKISHFKLDMINCNYRVRLEINRDKLFALLLKKKIKCNYETCIRRACVIIKYVPEYNNDEGKEISISVFEKGSIIIAGAKNKSQLKQSYMFINKLFVTHREDIQKNLLDEIIRKTKYGHLLEYEAKKN